MLVAASGVIVQQGGMLFAISFDSEPDVRLGKPRQLAVRGSTLWDVAPNGRFAMAPRVRPRVPSTTHVNVVLNWFEELKRLVPAEG